MLSFSKAIAQIERTTLSCCPSEGDGTGVKPLGEQGLPFTHIV